MTNESDHRPIRVMLIDDHPVVRCGLAEMLSEPEDIDVVVQADDAAAAVKMALEQRPDVILVDLRLPQASGVEVIKAVRRDWLEARFIVVTTYDSDDDILCAMQAGAAAYLLKDSFASELINAIRRVHAGERLIPPEVARRLTFAPAQSTLSRRELAVLTLIARGASNREAAAALDVSPATVKTYVTKTLFKLGVTDRTAAVAIALQRGLITL